MISDRDIHDRLVNGLDHFSDGSLATEEKRISFYASLPNKARVRYLRSAVRHSSLRTLRDIIAANPATVKSDIGNKKISSDGNALILSVRRCNKEVFDVLLPHYKRTTNGLKSAQMFETNKNGETVASVETALSMAISQLCFPIATQLVSAGAPLVIDTPREKKSVWKDFEWQDLSSTQTKAALALFRKILSIGQNSAICEQYFHVFAHPELAYEAIQRCPLLVFNKEFQSELIKTALLHFDELSDIAKKTSLERLFIKFVKSGALGEDQCVQLLIFAAKKSLLQLTSSLLQQNTPVRKASGIFYNANNFSICCALVDALRAQLAATNEEQRLWTIMNEDEKMPRNARIGLIRAKAIESLRLFDHQNIRNFVLDDRVFALYLSLTNDANAFDFVGSFNEGGFFKKTKSEIRQKLDQESESTDNFLRNVGISVHQFQTNDFTLSVIETIGLSRIANALLKRRELFYLYVLQNLLKSLHEFVCQEKSGNEQTTDAKKARMCKHVNEMQQWATFSGHKDGQNLQVGPLIPLLYQKALISEKMNNQNAGKVVLPPKRYFAEGAKRVRTEVHFERMQALNLLPYNACAQRARTAMKFQNQSDIPVLWEIASAAFYLCPNKLYYHTPVQILCKCITDAQSAATSQEKRQKNDIEIGSVDTKSLAFFAVRRQRTNAC